MRDLHYTLAFLILGCSSSSNAPQAVAPTGGGGAVVSGGSGSSDAGSNNAGSNNAGSSNATSGAPNGNGGAPSMPTNGPVSYGGEVTCGTVAKGGTPGPSTGTVDAWTNVTGPAINLDSGGDNIGIQDVLVDPVRPSDFYAFVCVQGVWRSSDYGLTWAKVSTGPGSDKIGNGKPWGEGIDSNRCRDPNTPPTLYATGSQGGFWTSTDGGVSWSMTSLPADKARPDDAYNVDVDPYHGKHVIVGFHEQPGLAESIDGGKTWRSVTLTSDMMTGISYYGFFIDTGDPETTARTWLLIPEAASGKGTYRTTDAGVTWTPVSDNAHNHGQCQIFQRKGEVFMAGVYAKEGWGVLRSKDFGATWAHVGVEGSQGVVYGTEKAIYAQNPWVEQTYSERTLDGETWTAWSLPMSNGPKRVAVTSDGVHNIIVAGNWKAGIWRYVEP